MSDAVWYYAQNDDEKGPVTPAQLKTLAKSGVLKPDDLVWKDGMEDWTPAVEIRGLIAAGSGSSSADAAMRPPGTASTTTPNPTSVTGSQPMTPVPMKPPQKPEGRWSDSPPPSANDSTANLKTSRPLSKTDSSGPLQYSRWIGLGLTLFGLLIALTARGCDSISSRYMTALSENVESTESLATPIGDTTSAGKAKELREDFIQKQASSSMWGVWRQSAFLFGSLLLSAGLLAVGVTGQGAERWMGFVMLALIILSLYIGGFAWIGSP